MKKITLSILSLFFVMAITSCNQEKKLDKSAIKTDEDKISYAIGYDLGVNFKKQSVNVNPDLLKEGLKNVLNGEQALMSEDEVKKALELNQKKIYDQQMKSMSEMSTKNKKEGSEFLAKKEKETGVKKTKSGLLYKVIKDGDGKSPLLEDEVKVHYKGTLLNGKEFDSSYKRKEPVSFPLNKVIKGWQEGVQLMKEGSKFEFYIPSDLAYGDKGVGADIQPGSTLIFEVELLKVGK